MENFLQPQKQTFTKSSFLVGKWRNAAKNCIRNENTSSSFQTEEHFNMETKLMSKSVVMSLNTSSHEQLRMLAAFLYDLAN